MNTHLIFPIGTSESCRYCSTALIHQGCHLTDHLSPDITHLLLDIPSFTPSKSQINESQLSELLRRLPSKVTIIGGNLPESICMDYQTLDLLKNEDFLAQNAAITAECAIQVAAPYISTTFADTPVLILGWGRIGKHLSNLLRSFGSPVTVAARNERDRAMLFSLGFNNVTFPLTSDTFKRHKLLFNTIPNPSFASEAISQWKDGIKIDLASYPGLIADGVIAARGLPGKYAPESAGNLIAQTILKALKEDMP